MPSGPRVKLELVADGLTSPLTVVEAPDGSGRLFIIDQVGYIYIVMPDGTRLSDPFLDLSSKIVALDPNYDERGLLGLAFHPYYASNGRFFVYYTAPLREGGQEGFDDTATWSEFHVSADPNKADAYYWKGVNMFAKATVDKNGKLVAPEGTAENLNKYLEPFRARRAEIASRPEGPAQRTAHKAMPVQFRLYIDWVNVRFVFQGDFH